jgi:hypothetical protein
MAGYVKGTGWLVFAGVIICLAGILNVIWGIAAIGESRFFVENQQYVLTTLNGWGWIVLIVGLIQVIAAFSIWAGGEFGRWVGILGASLSAIAALLTVPALPYWSLAIFFVDVLIIYGLVAHGGHQYGREAHESPPARG